MDTVTRLSRTVASCGLAAAGALHAVWALGSPWPAGSARELNELVVGNGEVAPGTAATWLVCGSALAGAAVAAGAMGDRPLAVWGRRIAGAALLARAALGGNAALRVLGLPPGGDRFTRLDRRYYRALFAVLGAALVLGARRSPS
ncbi:DUF3995 domain-containing protein [Serinibacter salmoneus]|uniref:DUF3995 domain-containing protein n=1 Tax=Serinibacter salmoneus TaxID=556530 RepID=UPI001474508B|nr:DUF3995 domain-containing protein [Serinibacter salmoneus]